MADRNSFKIEGKNKELVLFRNGKFLYVEGSKLTYGDVLFLETPTSGLLSVRAHNLLEKRINVDEEKLEELKKWLLQTNEEKTSFKENAKNIIKKKKEKIDNGDSENTKQTKEE